MVIQTQLYLYRLIGVGHSDHRAGSNDLLLAEVAGGSQIAEEQELDICSLVEELEDSAATAAGEVSC